MAIDDNTLYGLTGAQVKEMVQRRGNTEISEEASVYGDEGTSISLDSNGASGHLRVGVDIANDASEAYLCINDSYPAVYVPSTDRMYEAIANGIPSDVSYFYNDANYQSASQVSSAIASAMATKQDTLTAGTGISINNNVISATGGGGGLTYYDFVTTFGFDPVADGPGNAVEITRAQYESLVSFATSLNWDTSRISYTANVSEGAYVFTTRLTFGSYLNMVNDSTSEKHLNLFGYGSVLVATYVPDGSVYRVRLIFTT